MKKLWKTFILAASFFAVMTMTAAVAGQDEAPEAAVKVAIPAAESLKSLARGDLESWIPQLESVEEVDRIVLGRGRRIYYIDYTYITDKEESLKNAIDKDAKEIWLFTLDLDGKAQTFVEIAKTNGSYINTKGGGPAGSYGEALGIVTALLDKYEKDIPLTIIKDSYSFYFVCGDKAEYVLPVSVKSIDESYYNVTQLAQLPSGREVVSALYEVKCSVDPSVIGGLGIIELGAHLERSDEESVSYWYIYAAGAAVLGAAAIAVYRVRRKRKVLRLRKG